MTSNIPNSPVLVSNGAITINYPLLLQKYYLKLSLPQHLSNPNREPAFRNLVIRFLFTVMVIDRLPCSNATYAAAFPTGTPTRWNHQYQEVRAAFARRAAGAFMTKYGQRIWGVSELRGKEWVSLMGYLELVAGMETEDEIWKAFWEGDEEEEADADDGHLVVAGQV